MSALVKTSTVVPIPTAVGATLAPLDCVALNGVEYIVGKSLSDNSIVLYNSNTGEISPVDNNAHYEKIAGALSFSDVPPAQ